MIHGSVFAIDGDLGLRVDELRIGSEEESPTYTAATARIEHLSSLCSYRCEDGAARSGHQPLILPAIDGARAMNAMLPSAIDTVTLSSSEPVPLEEFEIQLAALQDLLTFAADMPCGRLHLEVTNESGQVIQIVGRDRFAPFEHPVQQPVEHSLRLSGDWAQTAVDRWWAARTEWRPTTQIAAGLRYQPGYVEADVILSAAAIEALATRQFAQPRPLVADVDARPILDALQSLQDMNPDQSAAIGRLKGELRRTTFRSKVEQLAATVDAETWVRSQVSIDEWTALFINTRNGIAHGSTGLSGGVDVWIGGPLLRSVRDANWIVLTLVVIKYLGAPASALDRAAERLGTRYGVRHVDTPIFI